MTNGISPFGSNRELDDFAEKFLRGRIANLRKDVGICLRSNKDRDHAYFPALMTCISFLDLMSGLYAGRLKGQGIEQLVSYARRFIDPRQTYYVPMQLAVVYEAFRHKLAHLGHPYVVFDTSTMNPSTQTNYNVPRMRLAWTVCKRRKRHMPIEIISQTRHLRTTLRPWPMQYDHRVFISIEHIRVYAIESITKPSGYLAFLRSNQGAKNGFAKCMKQYYPP